MPMISWSIIWVQDLGAGQFHWTHFIVTSSYQQLMQTNATVFQELKPIYNTNLLVMRIDPNPPKPLNAHCLLFALFCCVFFFTLFLVVFESNAYTSKFMSIPWSALWWVCFGCLWIRVMVFKIAQIDFSLSLTVFFKNTCIDHGWRGNPSMTVLQCHLYRWWIDPIHVKNNEFVT